MISPKRIDIGENIPNFNYNGDVQIQSNHIAHSQGNYNDFFQQHLIHNQPAVISNVTSQWKCSKLWVKNGLPNIDYLRTNYGDALVSVANCNEKYFNAQQKQNMKFRDFADYWTKILQNEHPSGQPCLYLKVRWQMKKFYFISKNNENFAIIILPDFNSGLALGRDWHFTRDFPNDDVYIVPPQFCSDWLNEYFTAHPDLNDDYRFVYMGPTGSWTPFHVDVFTSFSWSVNICGEKRWILLEPGEENKLKDKLGNLPYDISFLLDDANNNNNNNYANIKYRILIQKAGEAVFVPSGWYHQVWNMADTISINHNWINGCNIQNMWRSMKNNFEDVKNEIAEYKYTMDDWQSHCQMMLKSCFGMDFKDFYHFIAFILQRRKECIKSGKELKVYGDWILGPHQIKFDFLRLENICDIFENDSDVQILFNERILTKILIN